MVTEIESLAGSRPSLRIIDVSDGESKRTGPNGTPRSRMEWDSNPRGRGNTVPIFQSGVSSCLVSPSSSSDEAIFHAVARRGAAGVRRCADCNVVVAQLAKKPALRCSRCTMLSTKRAQRVRDAADRDGASVRRFTTAKDRAAQGRILGLAKKPNSRSDGGDVLDLGSDRVPLQVARGVDPIPNAEDGLLARRSGTRPSRAHPSPRYACHVRAGPARLRPLWQNASRVQT